MILIFICVCVSVLVTVLLYMHGHAYVGAVGDQKRTLNPLELDLQAVVGTRN